MGLEGGASVKLLVIWETFLVLGSIYVCCSGKCLFLCYLFAIFFNYWLHRLQALLMVCVSGCLGFHRLWFVAIFSQNTYC